MDKLTKQTVMHGLEALIAYAFASFVLYLFREPLTALLLELFHRANVVGTIETGMVILLGAVFSAMAKRLRADPNVTSVPDYVNN